MSLNVTLQRRAVCGPSADKTCCKADRGTVTNTGAGKATSGLKECQQVGVKLVFMRIRETVGRAGIDL